MEQVTNWKRLNGERIQNPIAIEVAAILRKECAAGHNVKICIGTDSQVKGKLTGFATVIVFIREGKGGFMLIRKEITKQKMSIKERMLAEAVKSVAVGYELYDVFTRHSVQMEIHADINTSPDFKSSDALKEAMTYSKGMGFDFKAKPNAFASSSCADKMV